MLIKSDREMASFAKTFLTLFQAACCDSLSNLKQPNLKKADAIYSEHALNEPLLSEPVCFDFAVKMKKIDIWKINVPQVSRPCHTHDDFI